MFSFIMILILYSAELLKMKKALIFATIWHYLFSAVQALKPLCPLPPYEDDVHLSCDTENGNFSLDETTHKQDFVIIEYNIDRNGFGGDGSSETGMSGVIQLLQNRTLTPEGDILLLSEVSRGCENYGGIDYSGALELAKALSLNYYYAVEYVESDHSDANNECSIGNAIMSRFQISNVQQLRFSSQCCRYGGRYGGRIDLIGDIHLSNGVLHVHSSHLESGQANVEMVIESLVVREQQAAEMTEVVFDDLGPVVIGGDLNSPLPKIDPTILRLEKDGYVNSFDVLSFSELERIQLDYIFSSPAVLSSPGWCNAEGCGLASDHVPYWATYVCS